MRVCIDDGQRSSLGCRRNNPSSHLEPIMNSHSVVLASRVALCFGLFAPLMTGCIGATDQDLSDGPVDEATEALAPPPATCQEVRNGNPGAGDGAYVLHIGHDPNKGWTAFCRDMATAPAEFLSLPHVGPGSNFSQYTAGGASAGTNVVTKYSKLRVDPATLLVDISDQTFATSSGSLANGSTTVTSMPYGVAMSCDASTSGVGNIDLGGTPFAVATSAFQQGGYLGAGSSTYSNGNRVVSLTGGGYCGWTCSNPATFNPFNDAGDFQLSLVFAP
jgi:hypothetical protein